jgi:hypothetical protein
MLCSHRKIVPSGVTLLVLLDVQSQLLVQGFRDLLCRLTGAEWTEHILLKMKHLQMIPHALDHSLSMVPLLCHKVKIQ